MFAHKIVGNLQVSVVDVSNAAAIPSCDILIQVPRTFIAAEPTQSPSPFRFNTMDA
jgi:hypothetical protein